MPMKKYFLRIDESQHNQIKRYAKLTRRSVPGAYRFIIQEFFKEFPKGVAKIKIKLPE